MKKIFLIILLSMFLFSCKGNINGTNDKVNGIINKNIDENKRTEDNKFLTGIEISAKELNNKKKKIIKELEDLEKETNDNIEDIKNKEIKKYSQINIKSITEKNLFNDINDKYLLVNLGDDKSHKKLEKILNVVLNLSKKGLINHFELHCKDLNFTPKELNILQNLNISTLSLEDMCGFKKENFSQTWYDKTKVEDFLTNAKYIKELYIGHISMDLFKKENGEIKFYSGN